MRKKQPSSVLDRPGKKARKKVAPAAAIEAILDSEVKMLKTADIQPHPKNPRKGDIKSIAESLKKNGQFRPIIVQRSTGYILGGNHTYLAAVSLKWKTIKAVFLDVDDQSALRIMLADNRTSDMATYDTSILADILKGLPDPVGTGYDDGSVRAILAAIDDQDIDLLVETVKPTVEFHFSDDDAEPLSFDERLEELDERAAAKREAMGLDEEEDPITDEEFQQALGIADIQVQLEALQEVYFESSNAWGVPDLHPSMLIDTLPDALDTWGGKEATPDDGVTTWIWNFGLASTSGLPWDRTIMSMFTYDTKFSQWWDQPAWNAARVIHNGLTQAIVPDFSMWVDEPRFFHLQSAYRAQWLGRFMQEAGIKVMPRLMWCDMESIKMGVLGIPKNPPVVAVCVQATTRKEMQAAMAADGLREFVKQIQPDALLVYSGNPGREMVESAHLPKSLEVRFVENYAAKRRGVVYDKPTGKMAVEKKARAEARKRKKVAVAQDHQDEEAAS